MSIKPIKICGITQQQNMLEVASLRPSYLGFIFYASSPRDVSEKIDRLRVNELSASIKKVAVVVNKPFDEVTGLVEKHGFDLVQLHGKETPQYCQEMRKIVKVIKTFPVYDELPAGLDDYTGVCDYFLFDTKTDRPGGSGKSFGHDLLNGYKGPAPFFLSGGLGPDFDLNSPVMKHPMLHALDINSRFESKPGIKNFALIEQFIEKWRG